MEAIIKNPVNDLEMPFAWTITDEYGESKEVELCRNGLEVLITEENKIQFVSKV